MIKVDSMESLYIHVPFCLSKCRYCDFYSVEYRDEVVQRYLSAIERELDSYITYLERLETIYIGGGTPSVLSEQDLEKLMNIISKKSTLSENYEFTIELNPATMTEEKIKILKQHGVNRVSIGVQSFNDRLLSVLGRLHNAQEGEKAIELVSQSFKNFSIDLIYGVPFQGAELWKDTLERTLSFYPPHIAAYELTPEEGTPLNLDLEKGALEMPGDEVILDMYEIVSSTLRTNNFRHYEISNYALPGYESRHNVNYWRRGEYIGIGPSAHSFVDGKRYRNISDVVKYCKLLECGSTPSVDKVVLTDEDESKERIFLGLRMAEGVALQDIFDTIMSHLGKETDGESFLNKLKPLADKGLLDISAGRLRLTEKGFVMSNTLIVEIMRTPGL